VLEILKLEEPAEASALARRLGLTGAAVRQHLAALEADGLIRAAPSSPDRPGRPAARWSLTDEGRALFPDRHGELTVQLLEAMRTVLGDDGTTRVIDARTGDQLAVYHAALVGTERNARARVDALARQRTAEGYMAEVVEVDGGLVLVEHHCPIWDAARSCPGFCGAELRLFRDALGADVDVERTEHLLSDGLRCSYRITPR